MKDFEAALLKRIESLEREVKRLKSVKSKEISPEEALEFERLPDSATVGKRYVAYRFKTSEERVMRGESGTGNIRRVCKRPLKFIKKEVDDAWREYSKTPQEKAAELIEKTNQRQTKRRRSIIKKSFAA